MSSFQIILVKNVFEKQIKLEQCMFHVLLCLLTNVERRKRSTFFFKFYCVSLLKNKIVLVNALRAGLWLKWREYKTLRER